MERESFIFYTSWLEGINGFPRDIQGEICLVLLNYCAFGKIPKKMKPAIKMAFDYARPQIDINNLRFVNGKKGGAPYGNRNNPNGRAGSQPEGDNQKLTKNQPRTNQEPTKNQPKTNQKPTKNQPNVNVNVNVINNKKKNNIKEKENENEKPQVNGFSPPSVSDVQKYIEEKNYPLDAEQFVAYYESNGWTVGKTKMKNWRAAVTTWAKREKNNTNHGSRNYQITINGRQPDTKESTIARQEAAIAATFQEADRECLRRRRGESVDFEDIPADPDRQSIPT